MKMEFSARPDPMKEMWCTWQGFLTAMPSLVFVVTGWKSNGKENASLQSWTAFTGTVPPCWGGSDDFICVMSYVPVSGHMYASLKETGACVLNFPSFDVYERCVKTIGNNEFDADEITAAGLTAESAAKVNAPRIRECFLNIECEFLWEHELTPGGGLMTVALKAVNIAMDERRFNEGALGRYGADGYLFQIDQPTNPLTGEKTDIMAATMSVKPPFEWKTK